MEIPQEVISAAGELTQMFGQGLRFVGQREGQDVYQFVFPEGQETGFPYVFLYKDGSAEVTTITGREAIKLLLSLRNE